jgi:hypothetical protein
MIVYIRFFCIELCYTVPAPGDEVGNRSRDEDFRRSGNGGDARTDVYGDSADVVVAPFDLAGVNP